ncbi:MFS transporter [Phormidium pseudopriestleyi FRX01]|uniref:MFS transporter n=1 Tax=Phormidium pseudopriestleyi FRX01 TaxID=1759528 RepID=A0ABS3FVY1_9CYAN|nr:MFS transporter [Phormidium pseudopriestleyi]MBO0351144.1 MFS transporter [Phormidium pseudopriestleyi FRX01]
MKSEKSLRFGALFLCVFLAIFSEVLLSPFYPQFFSKVFGMEDLAYTGFYIFVCRLTVVICAPAWGFLARFWEVKYLLYAGQAGAAVMTALMATSTSANQFLAYTICLLLFKSSYLLVYPLIIQLAGKERQSAIAGTYQAVFHGAIVAGTIAGAWMVNLEAPLRLFYGVAAADLFQFCLCLFILKNVSTQQPEKSPAETTDAVGNQWEFILALGLVILTFQLANNLVRPFFTTYVTQSDKFNVDLVASSYLFMIPSVMAIAALPYIRKFCQSDRLSSIYLIGIGLLAVTLFLQGWTKSLGIVVLARIVYGFCLAVTQATLELRLFGSSSSDRLHFNYSLAMSFANLGHLAAPLLASWAVSTSNLAAPLWVAAAICLANLAFAKLTIFGGFPHPIRVEIQEQVPPARAKR